jgi:hypothetical protein
MFANPWRKPQVGVQLVKGYFEWRLAKGGWKVPF